MTDSNILFIVFGFIFFCIVLSNITQKSEQMATFEQRTKKYYDACDALRSARNKLYSTKDPQEKEILKREIERLRKESQHQYCILPREDNLEILKRTGDSLEKTVDRLKKTNNDLDKTANALEESNQRLKESNDKLKISVEKMEQRIKEAK